MNFHRKKEQNLSKLVLRFRDIYAKNRLHDRVSLSSQTGQMLDIMMLKNANTDEGNLTNANSDLYVS